MPECAIIVPSLCFIRPTTLGQATSDVGNLVDSSHERRSVPGEADSLSLDMVARRLNSKLEDDT